MERYNDAELESLLRGPESELVERKESLQGKSPERVREAICAFANDLPNHRKPGVVFIGARDNGEPAGLEITDELLRQLADMKTDGKILPPPTMSVDTLEGAPVAVITVWPSASPPVTYKGRIYIRIGPRRGWASKQDEQILNEKRRSLDAPYDVRPVGSATIDDLDLRRFELEYLPSAMDAEALAANDRSIEERLLAAKMAVQDGDKLTPTVTGILALCARPQGFIPGAYAQFVRVDGEDLSGAPIDEEECDGSVVDILRRLDEKLRAHNRTVVDFASEFLEKRHSTYPQLALQELTRNAVMHRAYEGTHMPVRVLWFKDRIEIINPGGPLGATINDFGQPGIVEHRNPNLSAAMKVFGLAQRFGYGIPAARKALRDGGHPDLRFKAGTNWILCTVRARA